MATLRELDNGDLIWLGTFIQLHTTTQLKIVVIAPFISKMKN